jgi:hypothetical protein
MSITEPADVSLDDGLTSFFLVSQEGQKSVYRNTSGKYEIVVSHQEGKRNRRTLRLNVMEITADPFVPAENVEVSYSAYLVVDMPIAGFSNTDVNTCITGLMAWLASGTVTNQFLRGES